jgi:hypothetical protein
MNHLVGSEERKRRWYASSEDLVPLSIAVQPATAWEEILTPIRQHHASASEYEYDTQGPILSVPIAWLLDDIQQSDHTTNDEVHERTSYVPEKLLEILDFHGFLVVSQVLSKQECDTTLSLTWDWIEATRFADSEFDLERDCQIDGSENGDHFANNVSVSSGSHFPQGLEGGCLPFYGSGHTTSAWNIRSHPHVRRVFECLYRSNDLLASLDGCILWKDGMQYSTDRGWFHLDQNPATKPQQCCIQGLASVLDATPTTGGNVLVAQSHRHFPHHYMSQVNTCADFYTTRLQELQGDDWLEIDPHDEVLLDPRKIVSLQLHAGDLLLWDSRVVHCSYPALSPPTTRSTTAIHGPGRDLVRAAWAVTYIPQSSVTSPSVLEARRDAVNNARTLTHWIDKAAPLGAERVDESAREQQRVQAICKWQQYNGKKVLLFFDDLTAMQQELVVGKEYASTSTSTLDRSR